MPRVCPMPWPDSMYHAPLGSLPACFHSPSSRRWVPDLSPRETKRDCVPAMRLRASTALGMPLILAGSSSGPMMTKSLYMTSRRFCILPSSTYFRSREGACTRATSASPRAARARACPVPTEIVLTVRPVFLSNMGTRVSRSPESWVLVVVDRITVVDCASAGTADTEQSTTSSRRNSMMFPLSRDVSTRPEPLLCSREHTWRRPRNQDEARDRISRGRTARSAGPPGRRGPGGSGGIAGRSAGLPEEASAAVGPPAGSTFEELHPGRALELAEVPPRRPIGHAHSLDGLLEGAEPLHGLQELGASFAELDAVPEDDPELEPGTSLHRASHRATA